MLRFLRITNAKTIFCRNIRFFQFSLFLFNFFPVYYPLNDHWYNFIRKPISKEHIFFSSFVSSCLLCVSQMMQSLRLFFMSNRSLLQKRVFFDFDFLFFNIFPVYYQWNDHFNSFICKRFFQEHVSIFSWFVSSFLFCVNQVTHS